MLSSQFSNIRNLVFDQNSPVQPVSETRGDPLSVTQEEQQEQQQDTSKICLQYHVGKLDLVSSTLHQRCVSVKVVELAWVGSATNKLLHIVSKEKASAKCYLDYTHFDKTFYISYILHIQDLNKFNIQDKEIQGVILRCTSIQSSVALKLQRNKDDRQQNRFQLQV